MGTRTVRLDDEAEKTLATLRKLTGRSISEVLKSGLLAYEGSVLREQGRKPYDVYRNLDLGGGGDARAPAAQAKAAVVDRIKRKHGR